jgi:hypothetical protein
MLALPEAETGFRLYWSSVRNLIKRDEKPIACRDVYNTYQLVMNAPTYLPCVSQGVKTSRVSRPIYNLQLLFLI